MQYFDNYCLTFYVSDVRCIVFVSPTYRYNIYTESNTNSLINVQIPMTKKLKFYRRPSKLKNDVYANYTGKICFPCKVASGQDQIIK